MKSNQTIIRKNHMEQLYFITKLLDIKDPNIKILDIINQKIAQKLIEKTSMTDIAHQLSISTSTVIRKLNDFHFKHDFFSPSWDYALGR